MINNTIVPLSNVNDMFAVIDVNFDCANLKEGDLYVGCRNTGWELGICHKVNKEYNFIESKAAMIYSYDIPECKKVIRIGSFKDVREA